MSSYTFDIETDGLIPQLTHVKCLNIINNDTMEEYRFTDWTRYEDAWSGELTDVKTKRTGNMGQGLQLLMDADEICGHHIVGFDIPAIQKIYPWFQPRGKIFDTAACSRLLYVDVKDRDFLSIRKGKYEMDRSLLGTHKLAAWGIRLGGKQKGDFVPKDFGWTWDKYPMSLECDEYCMDDVRLNVDLVKHMKKRMAESNWPLTSLELEQDVSRILGRQMDYGWLYDVEAAHKLCAELMIEKIELEDKLQAAFPPWLKRDKEFTPKRDNAKMGYLAGARMTKVKLTMFNPGSRDQIANRLTAMYDWSPEKFTPAGKPAVDETVLGELPWAEAKLCAEYFTVNKKLGQVGEGKMATLKQVQADGRIHGYVNHNGAVTGRMTHSRPNVAQTDKDPRVRALYIVGEGKKLIGADADGIEGCCLGHFLAAYDGGAYIKVILKGDKSKGTDLHSMNRDATGMNSRNNAKTIFYAWMYGAGDYKLGTVIYDDWDADKQARFNERFTGVSRNKKLRIIGAKARARLIAGIKGMDKLIKKVKDKSKSPGYVIGLDGRRVYTRSAHAALNTLLQSAGALIMKQALVRVDAVLQSEHGLTPGVDYEFVGNIHDELQVEAEERHAELIGQQIAAAITFAGEYYSFRCPLSGSYDIGVNWSETH